MSIDISLKISYTVKIQLFWFTRTRFIAKTELIFFLVILLGVIRHKGPANIPAPSPAPSPAHIPARSPAPSTAPSPSPSPAPSPCLLVT